MCALDIPNTFIPGTKAKANEVNANFNAVKTFVDQNEVNIAQNTLDIQDLENTKAELNGAIEQRFQVADPNGNYDAVNKQWFNANTANSKDVIKGFKLTKQSDTSISASPGSCWDSTYEYMITSSSALTEDQANLGQNATYYVYVCADKETTNNELIFSLSNATPELPSGFEYFRLLGSFTTDGDGNILLVNNIDDDIEGVNDTNSGYIKMPNGLIFLWGFTGNIPARRTETVKLPIEVNTLVGVHLTLYSWSGRSSGDKNSTPPWADTYTQTSFIVHNYHEYETWKLFWFAVAY